MEKIHKRKIENIEFSGVHRHTEPDPEGLVELYWAVMSQDGFVFKICYNRFEVVTINNEEDPLELVIPLKGHYRNEYALSDGQEAADKAFETAYGLYKALGNIEYTALR